MIDLTNFLILAMASLLSGIIEPYSPPPHPSISDLLNVASHVILMIAGAIVGIRLRSKRP